MPDHDEEPNPVGRLTTMGLPPRPAGWVPEQPVGLAGEPDGGKVAATPLPPPPSWLDSVRLAVAERLPAGAGDRLRAMSSSAFAAGIVALVAVAVAVGIVVHQRHRAGASYSYSSSASSASTAPTSAAGFADGSSIVVDVTGKVRHPGLVTLPLGARVDDAIKAAGGALRPSVLAHTNLAARVTDGELLAVGQQAGGGGGDAAPGLVDLSTAPLAKLETLPGVGPVTAQKIIDWRNAHGGFTSVEQLQQVPGIGPTRYAELAPLVAP